MLLVHTAKGRKLSMSVGLNPQSHRQYLATMTFPWISATISMCRMQKFFGSIQAFVGTLQKNAAFHFLLKNYGKWTKYKIKGKF